MKVLSYGGGVQTFAMLIMIEQGLLEKPDLIIMADTKAEYPETEAHVETIARPLAESLGIPFITVVHENGLINGYTKKNSIPLPGFPTCTKNYKVRPINNYLRQSLGDCYTPGKPSVEVWIGISNDEARREIKPENQSPKWVLNTYPLLDKGYSRHDLIKLIEESEYPMPRKSGCFMCPYSGTKGFIKLKMTHPHLFEIARKMEGLFLDKNPEKSYGFVPGLKLDDLASMPSLFSFDQVESMINEQSECDSGGCFL